MQGAIYLAYVHLRTCSTRDMQMARRLLKQVCVEALANGEQTSKAGSCRWGCEMELVLLIAIFVSLADTGGGKAGW